MASLFIPRHYVEPLCMEDGELVLTDVSTNEYDDDELSLEGSSNSSVLSDVTTGTFTSLGQTLYQMMDKWHAYKLRGEAKIKRDDESPSSQPNGGDLPHFSPLQTPHGLSISMVDCSWQGPSIEVVPTDSIEDIMPLWKSEWTRDHAEWEEQRKGLLAIDDKLKRSRTHGRIDSLPTNPPLDCRSQSDLANDRDGRSLQSIVNSTTGNASINLPPSEPSMNEWNKFVQEKEKIKFNEVAIESIAVPLSVSEFYNHVLADNAELSFEKFMRDIGELDVHTSRWERPSASKASESTSRTIQYTHPVNAPMAPPTAKARKQQVLHKFGDAGLCVETCTVVEEVPMADCFVVEDRVWVHGAKDGSEGCSVTVTFQIRFVKSTMFRRVIENTTRKEYGVFWNQFAGLVRRLGKGSQEAAISLEEAPAILNGEEQKESLSNVLRCIRRLTQVVQLKGMNEICKINVQKMATFALDGCRYIRKLITEGDYALFVAGAVFFFVISSLNIVASRQMMMMDARLEQIALNQAILLKLLGNDGSCSH